MQRLSDENRQDLSVYAVATFFLSRWRILLLPPLLLALLGLVFRIVLPSYRADSRFLPDVSQSGLSNLAGVAAQLGVNLSASASGESLDLYLQLLRSREVLKAVVQRPFVFVDKEGDTIRTTLLALYNAKGETRDEQLLRAVERLQGRMITSADPRSQTISLQTRTPYPHLAELVNRAVLEELSRFNLEKKQSRASSERRFVEERLRATEADLRSAEGALAAFLVRNRSIKDWPPLQAEQNALQRKIDLAQQLFVALTESFEQARLAEVRNTPVITVIDSPEGSAKPTHGFAYFPLIGFVFGGVVALAGVLAAAYLRRARRDNPIDYELFRQAGSKTSRATRM